MSTIILTLMARAQRYHVPAVILQVPDRDAAKAWFNGPAYTEARQHRMAGADYQVTLVDGV